jgi:hypothetical protein
MDTTTPSDPAIVAIQARIAELNVQIEQHNRLAQMAAAIRDEFAEMIATLSRKPRARKPRAVAEATGPAEDAPRPGVFAPVLVAANDEAGDAAGEAA